MSTTADLEGPKRSPPMPVLAPGVATIIQAKKLNRSGPGRLWQIPGSSRTQLPPATRQGDSTSHPLTDGAAHIAFERMKTLGPCDV